MAKKEQCYSRGSFGSPSGEKSSLSDAQSSSPEASLQKFHATVSEVKNLQRLRGTKSDIGSVHTVRGTASDVTSVNRMRGAGSGVSSLQRVRSTASDSRADRGKGKWVVSPSTGALVKWTSDRQVVHVTRSTRRLAEKVRQLREADSILSLLRQQHAENMDEMRRKRLRMEAFSKQCRDVMQHQLQRLGACRDWVWKRWERNRTMCKRHGIGDSEDRVADIRCAIMALLVEREKLKMKLDRYAQLKRCVEEAVRAMSGFTSLQAVVYKYESLTKCLNDQKVRQILLEQYLFKQKRLYRNAVMAHKWAVITLESKQSVLLSRYERARDLANLWHSRFAHISTLVQRRTAEMDQICNGIRSLFMEARRFLHRDIRTRNPLDQLELLLDFWKQYQGTQEQL